MDAQRGLAESVDPRARCKKAAKRCRVLAGIDQRDVKEAGAG
jgi:hypothetical protein